MKHSAPVSARPAAHRRRTPVLLLWLLLVNTLGVSVLSWLALRSQHAEIEANRQSATRHALATLAAQIEHSVYEVVQEPMLLLRNMPLADFGVPELDRLREQQPELRLLLVLKEDFQPVVDSPRLAEPQRRFLAAAVQERALGEALDGREARVALRAFSDGDMRPPMLYAFSPLDRAGVTGSPDGFPGWLVSGFDMQRLAARAIDPLLAEFRTAHGLQPFLLAPRDADREQPGEVMLGGLMSGWRLASNDATGSTRSFIGQLDAASIAASVGLVIAVALISLAILMALRREQALADMRDRFVASVSHELKTPLSLIRMYAETLYLGRLREPERQHEYHRVLLAESERLSRMIGNVLDFAGLRDGAPLYRLAETDIGGTVQAVLRTYLPEWIARGACLRADIADDVPPVAHDPNGILQILLNLVDNAIKYAGPGASIAIRLLRDADRALLEVNDDGAGIEPAARQRLWRAVQRGRAAPEAEGTGLGLALVKQIVDAHHGALLLDAGPDDRGLHVQIAFPSYAGVT